MANSAQAKKRARQNLKQRMHNAKQMLQNSDWSIACIAKNLGFSQTSYFCKVFRQTYQITPQMYRDMLVSESVMA